MKRYKETVFFITFLSREAVLPPVHHLPIQNSVISFRSRSHRPSFFLCLRFSDISTSITKRITLNTIRYRNKQTWLSGPAVEICAITSAPKADTISWNFFVSISLSSLQKWKSSFSCVHSIAVTSINTKIITIEWRIGGWGKEDGPGRRRTLGTFH